ncbi:hypothetical protein H696_06139 [Fonticula alba]|uniref:Uncharacterized protein n=1 Tax=Fonticula alba TaxID=691883 RepID=A0A058YZP2_FONAL|nr:hypothetical protein H696_06139 [Fonticula alba]KCV67444.1 hypothetical protein H696_06139 [Fonticula alba]|eukprot:XP_009498171.1 hypothetical protein H696_06139 [Fonticula alba]
MGCAVPIVVTPACSRRSPAGVSPYTHPGSCHAPGAASPIPRRYAHSAGLPGRRRETGPVPRCTPAWCYDLPPQARWSTGVDVHPALLAAQSDDSTGVVVVHSV